MKLNLLVLKLVLAAMLLSCANKDGSAEASVDAAMENQEAASAKKIVGKPVDQRKIIKEGQITFESGDAVQTRNEITKSAAQFNAYISKDEKFDGNDQTRYEVTVRIPADKFDAFLAAISKTAKSLDQKSINSLDVTEEYIDIESRIRSKKELEQRYIELLRRANKVEELLQIEKEINNLRTEIESIEGRLKYLKDKVAYSTLTITFYEKTTSSFGFGSKIGDAIYNGWENLLWFLVGLMNLWPFVLITIAVIVLLRKLKRKRRARKQL